MKKRTKHYTFTEEEELNPMNSVSNLSDVMLLLAVGLMMGLIVHWNVNIGTGSGSDDAASAAEAAQSAQEDVITFSDGDLEDTQDLPEDMEPAGEVYYDPATGQYYIVKSGEE